MERQVLQPTNFILLLFIFLFSCAPQKHENKKVLSLEMVNAQEVMTKSSKGIFYVNGKRFSGMIYWTYPNGTDTLRVRRYHDGEKEGKWVKYYPNNILEEVRYYKEGKKEGEQIGYYPNGKIRFITNFQNDLYEGNAKAWTGSGRLIRNQNYHIGKEEGVQQVWYDNGKIKANYVIKEGRRFGLLGTKNCINVSDETF
ncbi:toxin-antitoxin system YwqK family antitoxin [Flammeovirga sp. EKP202]|uniref:toxin-antitoxin system YwqK family antitoxin n=1 Tax=Flammeovirga sp. EKP202 TaxID=2770592 RepID=UPI00165ECEE2|nr:toxin-antitoxin system YwqK family antitoxin [Flammeovirga sp. EKP202]MBD0403934.1 toxin-antitoxin system YwqK family antitoxin [Flammeovirga sp. EKP202]